MFQTRSAVIAANAVTGLFFTVLTLFLTGMLEYTIWPIVALIGSVILCGGLVWFAGWLLARTMRATRGLKLNTLGWRGWSLIAANLVVIWLTVGSFPFVLNVGPGADVRMMMLWSFLPEGNLLWAEGASAWISYICLTLSITAIVSGMWPTMKGLHKKVQKAFERRPLPVRPAVATSADWPVGNTSTAANPVTSPIVHQPEQKLSPTDAWLADFPGRS